VRCGDGEQVVEVLKINRLASWDQNLSALAGGFDRLGGDMDPVGDAGGQVVQNQQMTQPVGHPVVEVV
jgi:hypothetical protein